MEILAVKQTSPFVTRCCMYDQACWDGVLFYNSRMAEEVFRTVFNGTMLAA